MSAFGGKAAIVGSIVVLLIYNALTGLRGA